MGTTRRQVDARRLHKRLHEPPRGTLAQMEAPLDDQRALDRDVRAELAPFSNAREASQRIEGRLEAWERTLEDEAQKLCRDILGVRVGDTVLTTLRGKVVRVRANRLHVHGGESGIYFSIYGTRFRKDGVLGNGTRFRKDGVLGKRDDMVILNIERPLEHGK